MTTPKKELAVAALQNGTVIDRIPSSALFKAVRILGIEKLDKHVTIGNNLESKKLGTKGIMFEAGFHRFVVGYAFGVITLHNTDNGLGKYYRKFFHDLTTEDMARAVDWAGVRSGRDYDKWKETGLTASKGVKVSCPYIKEAPLSIECRVKDIINLGSHDLFIAEVLDVLADDRFIDDTTGAFDMSQARLIAYSHGAYYSIATSLPKCCTWPGRSIWSRSKPL